MTQHAKIISILDDCEWHCTSEMYRVYIADPRTRLAELKKKFNLESRWCQTHKHEGQMKEWRLVEKSIEWWKEAKYLKPKTLKTEVLF